MLLLLLKLRVIFGQMGKFPGLATIGVIFAILKIKA